MPDQQDWIYETLPDGRLGKFPPGTSADVIAKVTGKKISAGAGSEPEKAAEPGARGFQDDGSFVTRGGRAMTPSQMGVPAGGARNPVEAIQDLASGKTLQHVGSETRKNLPTLATLPAAPLAGPARAAIGVGSKLGVGSVLAGLLAGGGRAAQIGMDKTEGTADPTLGEAAADIASTGANTAATNFGLGKGLQFAGALAQKVAPSMLGSALKVDRGYLEKMAGARTKGIPAMQDRIFKTALSRDINPMSSHGTDQIQQGIDTAAASRTAAINAAPNVPIPGQAAEMLRAPLQVMSKAGRGPAPQARLAEIKSYVDDLQSSPRMSRMVQTGQSTTQVPTGVLGPNGQMVMRPQTTPIMQRRLQDQTPVKTAEAIEEGNQNLRGLFGGNSKNAEIQARLATQKAMTRSLDRATSTGKQSRQMRDLIDLRNVSNIARRRSGATNPLSITDVISLSSGHPGVAVASAAMKPRALGRIAVETNKAGRGMVNPGMMQQILRAIAASSAGQKFSEWTRPDEPEE